MFLAQVIPWVPMDSLKMFRQFGHDDIKLALANIYIYCIYKLYKQLYYKDCLIVFCGSVPPPAPSFIEVK